MILLIKSTQEVLRRFRRYRLSMMKVMTFLKKRPAINCWLIREELEHIAATPIFAQNENQTPSKKTTLERTTPYPIYLNLVFYLRHTKKDCRGRPKMEKMNLFKVWRE